MTLRRRLAIAAATAVGLAILLAIVVSYLVVRAQLRGTVDGALRAQATAVQRTGFHALGDPVPSIPASAGGPAQYVQIIGGDGTVYVRRGGLVLPVGRNMREIAEAGRGSSFADIRVGENHLREIVFAIPVEINNQPATAAVQLARPLNSVDHVLARLRLMLVLLFVGGIGLAAVLGRLAARRVLVPLAEVAGAIERIGLTDDLSTRLELHADDEVGQLARRFNEMLGRLEHSREALDDSVRAQRQLIADASHELRTPVTSLRTNVELLLAEAALPPEDRRRLMADVVEQTEELTALVGDLIELGRGDLPAENAEEVRLDHLVEESIARARRNTPTIAIRESLVPVVVRGVPERLGRAINNLLDNAARYCPPGTPVEVTVDAAGVRVRDHGPGIGEEDLPFIFDRFFRGAVARGRQGSGLGLAIVRQVAVQHGGSVTVENAPEGGALFTLRLPGSALGEGAGDAGLTGGHETPAQQPEAQAEDGYDGDHDEPALAHTAQRRGEGELGTDGREGSEQHRV